jgi:tetratricopeptide (TPR) repeat protein
MTICFIHERWRLMALFIGAIFFSSLALFASPKEDNDAGIAAYEQGRFEEAITYFERARTAVPDNPTVRRNLCHAYQAWADRLAGAGDMEKAIDVLRTAIQVEPDNPGPYIQIGAYFLQKRRISEAITYLEQAIEIQPGQLDAHELLGQAYYEDNDIPSARAQWEYVLEMDPQRKSLRERYEKALRENAVEGTFKNGASRHFRISYPREFPAQLRAKVLSVLERCYIDLGRKFGGVYPPSPVQVIVYEAEQFAAATNLAKHVGAVYDGKIRVPLTDERGETLPEEEIERRVMHEYVHVVVRYLADEKVPFWLNEGLAEALSKASPPQEDPLWNEIRTAPLSMRRLENIDISKAQPEALRRAYLQAHAAADYLLQRFGSRRLAQVLQDIGRGLAPEEALHKVCRIRYNDLDAALFPSP